eukprot:gene7833-biopygen7581
MLCYAMLCNAMRCDAMRCYAMLVCGKAHPLVGNHSGWDRCAAKKKGGWLCLEESVAMSQSAMVCRCVPE